MTNIHTSKENGIHYSCLYMGAENFSFDSHLGRCAPDGGADNDVRARIGKAAAVFRKLDKIWSSKNKN